MASKVAPSNEDGNDLDASCHTLRTCTRLRQGSQDEELRKVIEKQRIVIRDLRKALAKVTADRDNLLAKFDISSSNNAATGDRPPAATPVQHEMLMMMSDEDDALSTSPSSSSCCSTASSSNPTTTGPIPPPRSPFRQHNVYINNNQHHPTSPISSGSNNSSAKEQLTEDPSSTPHRVDSLSLTCASGRRNPNTRSSSLPVASFKRSISPTTAATMMVNNSPVSAILDKDKQLFARYQESMQRTTVTNGDHVECSTKTSISAGDISTHDDDLSPSSQHQQQWLWPSPPPIPPSERKMSTTSTYHRRHVRRASSQPAIVTSTSSSLRNPAEKKIDRLLDGVSVKVLGSNITTNDKGKGVVSFTISVGQNADKELWCIEKRYSHFLTLDTKLKSQCKSKTFKTTKLPDKALFATHAPSKADQRKHAIEKYLQRVIEVPWPDLSVLHDFLNSDKTYRKEESHQTRPGYKAGYLTRRGKSFVGWKTRYFVYENGVLRYYDNPEGALLGTILIPDAQIRPSNSQSSSHEPHHAFLIVEPKKAASPGSGVYRHLLCAESDKERDEWVDVLTQAKKDAQDAQHHPLQYHPPRANSADSAAHHEYHHHDDERPPLRQRSSMDQVYMPASKKYSITSSVGSNRRGSIGSSRPCSPSADDQEGGALDGKKKKGNRRTFWSKKMATGIPSTNSIRGLLSRNSTDTSADTTISTPQSTSNGKNNPSNKVFGVPLEEAVRASRISDTCHLPAIVIRCIEYLEANNATREEGIYRLSGSAVKIRSLREEFDQGTDVNLLESNEHHDIHAVAGVFKMWLRELPGNVLTEELLPEFLPVIDLVDRQERVQELGRLVSMLPLANYALLRSLCTHLIGVVTSSETNKMNARNVGIIFSPTLQIPTGIFNLFLSEFQYIFMTDNNDITISADSNKIQLDSITDSSLSTSSTINTDPLHPTQPLPRVQHTILDEQGRSNRNSVHYMNGTPFSIVGLEKGNAHVADDDEVDDLDFHNDTLDDDNEPTSSNGSLHMSESFHSNDSKPDMTTTSFTASGQLLAMK